VPAGILTSRRLGIGVLCLICLIGSVALAWWQWDRYQSASGTLQNLGYVLQWPLFGLFPAFMVWRIRRLRREAVAAEAAEAAETQPEPERRQEWGRRPVTEVPAPRPTRPARIVPDAEDDELAAYNRYLAELNARDQQDR
jgi:DNA-binding transcriptional regulator of glucitol operon